jgi:hypothetical protein
MRRMRIGNQLHTAFSYVVPTLGSYARLQHINFDPGQAFTQLPGLFFALVGCGVFCDRATNHKDKWRSPTPRESFQLCLRR